MRRIAFATGVLAAVVPLRVQPTRKRTMNGVIVIVLFSLLAVGATGCADVETGPLADALDRAVLRISNNSADWQGTVTKLEEEIPSRFHEVGAEVRQTLNTAIAASSVEFRCDADFIGTRVGHQLEVIRYKFGQEFHLGFPAPKPAIPSVCSVNPVSVDLGLPPVQREQVVISGYDFANPTVPLTVRLNEAGGTSKDVSAAASVPSTYQLVLNTGKGGIEADSKSESIDLSWGPANVHRIPVVRPEDPVCGQETITLDATERNLVPTFPNPNLNNFDGSGPIVNATTSLRYDPVSRRILGTLTMTAVQTHPGGGNALVTAAGATEFVVATLPDKYALDHIVTPTYDSFSYEDHTVGDHDIFNRGNGGLVEKWDFVGDANGNDIGSTKVAVTYNRIQYVAKQNMLCKNVKVARPWTPPPARSTTVTHAAS